MKDKEGNNFTDMGSSYQKSIYNARPEDLKETYIDKGYHQNTKSILAFLKTIEYRIDVLEDILKEILAELKRGKNV